MTDRARATIFVVLTTEEAAEVRLGVEHTEAKVCLIIVIALAATGRAGLPHPETIAWRARWDAADAV
jgi:hypothetical protein